MARIAAADMLRGSDPEPDPMAGLSTELGGIEEDTSAELEALAEGFRDRLKRENDRKRHATDTEFWFAVCWDSREQRDAFLHRVGLPHFAGRPGQYIPGDVLARAVGVE